MLHRQPEFDAYEEVETLPEPLQVDHEFIEELDDVIDRIAMNSRWSNVDVASAVFKLIRHICNSGRVVQ